MIGSLLSFAHESPILCIGLVACVLIAVATVVLTLAEWWAKD